ncbi:hypothetical protein ACI65C_013600, partial [Semiaphis heraclei]
SKPEPLFVKFVNTQDYRHTGEYLKEQIINVLEEYGKEKFFAFELVKKECEIIQPLGCAAHGLHLLCFDIIQCSNIQEFMQTAASVVLSAVLKKYQLIKKINIQLKLPVKTRWGSYLYCLDSLNKNK